MRTDCLINEEEHAGHLYDRQHIVTEEHLGGRCARRDHGGTAVRSTVQYITVVSCVSIGPLRDEGFDKRSFLAAHVILDRWADRTRNSGGANDRQLQRRAF